MDSEYSDEQEHPGEENPRADQLKKHNKIRIKNTNGKNGKKDLGLIDYKKKNLRKFLY